MKNENNQNSTTNQTQETTSTKKASRSKLISIGISVVCLIIICLALHRKDTEPESAQRLMVGTSVAEATHREVQIPVYDQTAASVKDAAEEPLDEIPECTRESIPLALYKVTPDGREVVTTSADEKYAGRYVLSPDTVYVITWDAACLYCTDEWQFNDIENGKVDADVVVSGDFFIGGGTGGDGVLNVNIHDNHRHIAYHAEYVGELHVASDSGNLGIEFGAEQCSGHVDGDTPHIQDGEFTVYFYTSGEYAESVTHDITSFDGRYSVTYGTNGGDWLNGMVTRPAL